MSSELARLLKAGIDKEVERKKRIADKIKTSAQRRVKLAQRIPNGKTHRVYTTRK